MILGIDQQVENGIGYAQADLHSTKLHLSGMVPIEPGKERDQDYLASHLRSVYSRLEERLQAHGATLQNVTKETIYSKDMDTLIRASGIRNDVYGENGLPNSTWIEIAPKGFTQKLIEVDIQADIGIN